MLQQSLLLRPRTVKRQSMVTTTASKQNIPGLIPFTVPAVVIDIETTGLSYKTGDKIVEIAAVVIAGKHAGQTWQSYVNPERSVPEEVVKIHGLRYEFLIDKPKFADAAPKFLDFLARQGKDTHVIAHNGVGFDFPFLNHQLQYLKLPTLTGYKLVDSLHLARHIYPNRSVNLNAICRYLGLDLSERSLHSALLDCQLLGRAYQLMAAAASDSFALTTSAGDQPRQHTRMAITGSNRIPGREKNYLRHRANPQEIALHQKFIANLNPEGNSLWDEIYAQENNEAD